MSVRAIRGATQLDIDAREHLYERTQELVEAVLEANGLDRVQLISIFFTCTPDIHSDFPATAARQLGLGEVPLMCAVEMDVATALPRVIRFMMHVETERSRNEITHVYLHGAKALRRDLAQ